MDYLDIIGGLFVVVLGVWGTLLSIYPKFENRFMGGILAVLAIAVTFSRYGSSYAALLFLGLVVIRCAPLLGKSLGAWSDRRLLRNVETVERALMIRFALMIASEQNETETPEDIAIKASGWIRFFSGLDDEFFPEAFSQPIDDDVLHAVKLLDSCAHVLRNLGLRDCRPISATGILDPLLKKTGFLDSWPDKEYFRELTTEFASQFLRSAEIELKEKNPQLGAALSKV